MASVVRHPLARREVLGYAQVAAVLLLFFAFAGISLSAILPKPEWIDLGTTQELAYESPTKHVFTLRDGQVLTVWLVHTPEKWLAFDALMPFTTFGYSGSRCLYEWEPVTQLFEDPCSGAKFSSVGEFVNKYDAFVGRTVQNLDQYMVSLRNNHVFIDASHVIHAEPFVLTALTENPN